MLVDSMTFFSHGRDTCFPEVSIFSRAFPVISPKMPHSLSRNALFALLAIPYPRRVFFLPDCEDIIPWISSCTSRGIKEIFVSSGSIERIMLRFVSSTSDILMRISRYFSNFSLFCRSIGFCVDMSLSWFFAHLSFSVASMSQAYHVCQRFFWVMRYVSPKSPGGNSSAHFGLSGTDL